MIRDSDDKEWQALKDKVRKRDKACRFLSILTPVERVYFDKSNPTQKHLDCAHVFPVSTHPLMVYNEDNVYLLCREAHHRIDDFLSPLTGNECSMNRHFWWWWRIINKSTEQYDKNKDYHDMVTDQIHEKY
jgi:hypothetical protein